MAGARTALLVLVLSASATAVRRQDVAPPATPSQCPEGTPEGCDCELQCCAPGAFQKGDNPNGKPSFCTDKPFQESYKMRIYEKVPVQINLRDYCTDEILFSSYSAPKVDKFSLVEFPCTYRVSDCALIKDPIGQEECEAGFSVYTKELNCTGPNSFYEKFISSRICNEGNVRKSNGEIFWNAGHEKFGSSASIGSGQAATIGACHCNYSAAVGAITGKTIRGFTYTDKQLQNLTVGVPNGFIKEGMSTFYVEVVVGGRSTAERGSDSECVCSGPADVSAACLCELGTKKIPYIYNNSFVPSLTALVSMRKGQLYYTNTFVRFNFEETRSSCSGCAPDYCFGVPLAKDEKAGSSDLGFPETWRRTDFDLRMQAGKVCAVPAEPSDYNTEYYCRLPQTKDEVNRCSLKVYIAWAGTDRYDTPLESSNMMFSKFTQMGVGNIASQFLASGGSMVRQIDSRVTGGNDAP